MSAADWAIVGVTALAIGLAVFLLLRRKKRGGNCCGTCGGCAMRCDCGKNPGAEEKTADKRDGL